MKTASAASYSSHGLFQVGSAALAFTERLKCGAEIVLDYGPIDPGEAHHSLGLRRIWQELRNASQFVS
jgi:hypothetical protein